MKNKKKKSLLLLHLQVRGSRVPQSVCHPELQTVRQRLLVWVDDVNYGSLVQLQLREPLWYKATFRIRENSGDIDRTPLTHGSSQQPYPFYPKGSLKVGAAGGDQPVVMFSR